MDATPRNVDTWRKKAGEAEQLLQSGDIDGKRMSEALGYLSSLMYPLEGLSNEVVEHLLREFVGEKASLLSSECSVMLGRLVSNLITYQKVSLSPGTQEGLLFLFLSQLTTVGPPTELLYACAALAQAGTTQCPSHDIESLLHANGTVITMAMSTGQVPIEVQRAALNYVSTLCQVREIKDLPTSPLLDRLLPVMLSHPQDTDTLMQTKLLFSEMKCLHSILTRSPALQSSSHLPNLLAILRAAMTLGLPGQPQLLQTALPTVVQSPRLVTPPSASPKQRAQTVAGPQPRRKQRRAKEQKAAKNGRGNQDSSEGEGSLSDGVKLRPSASFGGRGSSWSSSESEMSDSEPAPSQIKVVLGKIRHLAFSCLTAVFKELDTHTKFSYGLTFLPDGPRPPNSPPSLMTCVLKDPLPKCRSAAVSVLYTLLEGSKVYLAPADDRPRPSHAFTPYSVTLGNTVQELHRSLLLAMTTESQHSTLTQVVRTLAQLVASCPYHQLSEGYIRRVTTAVERYSTHRDTNVRVACLTCAGAVVSISPPLPEVVNWLTNEGSSPWILEFCLNLLQAQNPLVVQTEALQVLTVLPRFYFPQLSRSWLKMRDVCLALLARGREGIQHHLLKMFEELGRTLATLTPPPSEAIQMWEQLLSDPLSHLLQAPSEHPSLCSQSCSVLATIGPHIIDSIKVPCRTLALTLPLGLCRDEASTNSILSNAVRVLGVFVTYNTLRKDESFLIDCQSAILHCLGLPSPAVRVQASWALANFTDPLSFSPHPALKQALYTAVVSAVKDGDKVRCNGVRAAGNLLKELTEEEMTLFGPLVESLSTLIASCVDTGSVKGRWNTCYACYGALSNPVFGQYCSSSVKEMVTQLCNAVQTSKNFKVRINAALALSASVKYLCSDGALFVCVWEAVLAALETSDHQVDFSEYKHANSLKTQLFDTLMLILGTITAELADLVKDKPLPSSLEDKLSQLVKAAFSQVDTESKDEHIKMMGAAITNLTLLGQSRDLSGTPIETLLVLLKSS